MKDTSSEAAVTTLEALKNRAAGSNPIAVSKRLLEQLERGALGNFAVLHDGCPVGAGELTLTTATCKGFADDCTGYYLESSLHT